jgi:hypothetical protein
MRTVNRKHPTLLIYVVGIGLPKGYGLFGYDHCKASQPMPLLCELCKLRRFLVNETQVVQLRKRFEAYTGPVVNAGDVR